MKAPFCLPSPLVRRQSCLWNSSSPPRAAGDALAQAIVAETADYLSLALNNLACILDPEVIVINGELAEFGDLFVATLRQRIGGVLPIMPEIVLSPLGLDAAVLGAVALVVRETGGVVRVVG